MRHFCSTTAKPEYENRAVLAHKGLQKQPEGGTEEKNESSSLFLYLLGREPWMRLSPK